MLKTRTGFLLTAILIAAGGCGGDEPPPLPEPGTVTLSFATPGTTDGAVLLSIQGPSMTNPTATNSSDQLFSRLVAPRELRVIVVGNLASGPLLTIDVPNVNDLSAFSATVLEVADRNDDLRPDITAYSVTVPGPTPTARSNGITGPVK